MSEHSDALPTVRDVLGLAELAAGAPELMTGEMGLERPVRWAHVVAGSGAVSLLDGGELVLTTGAGWPQEADDRAGLNALVETLVETGPAAIVFELGTRFDATPETLVQACIAGGVPLIVLHREVRFVQITQRVHQRLLEAQSEALEARAEVHAMLTELGLNRSPVDYVVERIAETIGAPVVLEDAGHQVVSWSGTDPTVLDHWARAERRRHGFTPELPEGAIRVPVEAQGTRWGSLTALPGPPHPAGRDTVLELGAFALALARLADPEGEQWIELTSKRLFDAVLEGRYSGERELTTQLAAGGLPVDGRVLLGATLTGTGDFGTHDSLELAILSTALRRAVAPDGHVVLAPAPGDTRSLLVLLSFLEADPRLAPAHSAASLGDTAAHPLAARLAQELDRMLPATTPPSWRAHLSLGVAARRPLGLISSLERVATGSRAIPAGPDQAARGRVVVQLAEERPLAYLVRGFAGTPELEEFATTLLDPLAVHDASTGAGHSGDLLRVLAAYLAHPTNRSLAAQRARLSRSVFYQRIALIEDLLGVDLTDGETLAGLTVALLARGEM